MMMKERTTARVFGIVRRIAGPDPIDQQTVIAIAGSMAASLILAGAILISSAAKSEPTCTLAGPPCESYTGYYFELFAADHGASVAVFRPKVKTGPFFELAVCYAIGAIEIDGLGWTHPDTDFMGRCDGGLLLTGREIADRALALLPKDSR